MNILFIVFQNVVLGSLKSFFQLNHQVDISMYLTLHSITLGVNMLSCTFSPISPSQT